MKRRNLIMKPRKLNKVSTMLSMILLGSTLMVGTDAFAKGGTAKPPQNPPPGGFVITPNLSEPLGLGGVAGPGQTVLTGPAALLTGFSYNGIITAATVDANGCSGTVTMDNKTVVVPCNLIVQMPANTLTWANFVQGTPGGIVAGLEARIDGNKINATTDTAALIYISQQSVHTNSGYVTAINYATGDITVDGITTLRINDPNGRFGRAQSPDPRFSVDDQNPTIHAATGYPMCVPRSGSDLPGPNGGLVPYSGPLGGQGGYALVNGIPQDPLCPQINRPFTGLVPPPLGTPAGAVGCRNWGGVGNAPPVSGEIPVPAAGQLYCSAFVMKAVRGAPVYPTGIPVNPLFAMALVGGREIDSDPRKQAPFEVGDFITYSGTVIAGGVISAHTVEANVGIYTTPGTQPAYISIGEFGIGSIDLGAGAIAINGAGIESTNRIFLEASTTDFKTPVDIYLVDDTPIAPVRNRWVTPFDMTGECDAAGALAAGTVLAANCGGASGGITTANVGPQPNRERIRAVKSPLGLLTQPSRYIRVMQRSLCLPVNPSNGLAADGVTLLPIPNALDVCLNAALARATADPTGLTTANGLAAGQYFAPVFEYIFPENVKPGALTVPYDFWHLPFLRNGESGNGPLTPTPW